MEKLIIEGGNNLMGEIPVAGMKNSALPIICACLLIEEECIIENVPKVSDILNTLEILRGLGAEADFCENDTVDFALCENQYMRDIRSLILKPRDEV